MYGRIEEFEKKHDFVICIDSDGTAIDSMDIKHKQCFGPIMVDIFGLEANKDAILARWNEINLYSLTRGINRFKGLAKALTEVNVQYQKIQDIDALNKFATTSSELSNASLKREIDSSPSEILSKALEWSNKVNEAIASLNPDDKKSYLGVKECLEMASSFADIIVLSSANREAVLEEWEKEDLLQFVSLIFAQDSGSKLDGLKLMLSKGYEANNILMLGDAPSDLDAARAANVNFYPILVRQEDQSWKDLKDKYLTIFKNGEFSNYASKFEEDFKNNLTPNL